MTDISTVNVLTMDHQLHNDIHWFACGTDSEQLHEIGMRQQFHVICLAKKLHLRRGKTCMQIPLAVINLRYLK